MNRSLSKSDRELLSAYLDEELDGRQVAALKARLEEDDSLQRALKQLQHTRALLRRAPQRRAPRSFALRPDMLAAKSTGASRWPFSMGWVSALATLLLAVVLVSDFARFGLPRTLMAAAPAAAPAAEGLEEPQALKAPEAADQSGPAQGEADAEGLESATAGGEASPQPSPSGELQDFTAEGNGAAPPEEAPRAVQAAAPTPRTAWRAAEIGLAALALVSGWSAWRNRKRRS